MLKKEEQYLLVHTKQASTWSALTLITMSTLYLTLQSFFVNLASRRVTSFSVSSMLVCVISAQSWCDESAAVHAKAVHLLPTHWQSHCKGSLGLATHLQ